MTTPLHRIVTAIAPRRITVDLTGQSQVLAVVEALRHHIWALERQADNLDAVGAPSGNTYSLRAQASRSRDLLNEIDLQLCDPRSDDDSGDMSAGVET